MNIHEFRIYRFRNQICFDFPGSETFYISPALASEAAQVIQRFAKDCFETTFAASTLGTETVTEARAREIWGEDPS